MKLFAVAEQVLRLLRLLLVRRLREAVPSVAVLAELDEQLPRIVPVQLRLRQRNKTPLQSRPGRLPRSPNELLGFLFSQRKP